MTSAAEKLRAEGRAEGRTEVLTDMLEHKFGSLPEQYKEQIAEAGLQEITRWYIRALDSSSLDQVFSGARQLSGDTRTSAVQRHRRCQRMS